MISGVSESYFGHEGADMASTVNALGSWWMVKDIKELRNNVAKVALPGINAPLASRDPSAK